MTLHTIKAFFLSITLICVCVENVHSFELQEAAKYKLREDFSGFYLDNQGKVDLMTRYFAGRKSKFYVYAKERAHPLREGYIVKFSKVELSTQISTILPQGVQIVDEMKFYVLYTKKKSDEDETYITLQEYRVRQSFAIDHGILVVPFKFRTRDGSLTGESSLGYYVGPKLEWLMGSGTIFFSVGLSRLAITDVNQDIDHRTGLTVATGLVLTNRKSFQVAVVGGIDHLGGNAGDDWKFEDDPWVSLAIGYNFATPK